MSLTNVALLKGNNANVDPLKVNKEQMHFLGKFFFISASFSQKEIHQMFVRFIKEIIDQDGKEKFSKSKMIDCFEKYAGDDKLLGEKRVGLIIAHIGVDPTGGLMSLFKDGGDFFLKFPAKVYEEFFENILNLNQEGT